MNATQMIEAFRKKIADQENVNNEKHAAFETVTTKWNGLLVEAHGIVEKFTATSEEDGKQDLDRVKEILNELVGSTKTVAAIGLNTLPDAVKEPPTTGDAPASQPSLTPVISGLDVHVIDENTVVVSKEKPENAVEVTENADQTSRQEVTENNADQS